jgi:ribonuclease R
MIAANVEAAKRLSKVRLPGLYRVHEGPKADRIDELAVLLNTLGLKLPSLGKLEPHHLSRILKQLEGKPEAELVETMLLRSMSKAVYQPKNVGHFGLALHAYAHFTSPIRRYPDLVVHRILKGTIARRSTGLSEAQLDAIATESSERERLAAQAERELFEWKKMLLMEKHLGDTFEAIVLTVWKDGFNVELLNQFVEGFVSVTDLPDGEYRFEVEDRVLISRRTKRRFRLGDRLMVTVARVDKLLRRVHFHPVLESREPRKRRK